jgi:RNA 3'-terminal phosphate cyclase
MGFTDVPAEIGSDGGGPAGPGSPVVEISPASEDDLTELQHARVELSRAMTHQRRIPEHVAPEITDAINALCNALNWLIGVAEEQE